VDKEERMRIGGGIGVVLVALALCGEGAAQEAGGHVADWRKCRRCLPALGKAMSYLKENLRSDKPRRVIGSKLGGYVFGGFAFMMEGGSPRELEECVNYCRQAVKDEGFNRNWYLGMGLYFLAEYATKHGLTPEVERGLRDGLRMAVAQQEETGGWCHHREMWKKDGYNLKGGGKDLGMITAEVFAALLEMKALGIEPGPVLEKARKNLETITDGAGVRYGTDNNVGDAAMARASYALLGFQAAGLTADPLALKYARGLEARYKRVEEGVHGFAPLHYFSVAAAMHRLGPDEYAKFSAEYLDKLIATQTPEGVVPLHGEDDVASTAVFACIVMMQREGTFRPPSRKKKPEAPPPAPPEKTEAVRRPAVDPKAVAAWDALLAAKVRREVAAGRPVRFRFRLIGELVSVESLDEAGAMSLRGSGAFPYRWPDLTLQDRRDLAVSLERIDDPEGLRFAAFYRVACGETADEALRRLSVADAERVRAALGGGGR
jgi:hypothetical protein